MAVIQLVIQLCDECHSGSTEDIILITHKKYAEIPKQYCSSCMKELKLIKKEVLVKLNGA